VHAASCTLAVISQAGKRLTDVPIETNGQARVEAISAIDGWAPRHCFPRRPTALAHCHVRRHCARVSTAGSLLRPIGYTVLLAAGLLLPLALAASGLPIVGASYGPERRVFELLGATGSVALLAVGALELRRRRGSPPIEFLPLLLGLAVAFQTLVLVSEFSERLYDYQCYEVAAKKLLAGESAWGDARFVYLYPPLLAQTLAALYLALQHGATWIGLAPAPASLWDAVFYLYQAVQPLLAAAAFALTYRVGRLGGLEATPAALIAAGLLLVNNPVVRTLRWSQVNLWVLDAVLLGVVLRVRAPLAAGAAIAFGAHLKLQPLVLALPWIAKRQWRALAGLAAGLLGLALLETRGGRDLEPWRQFLAFAPSFPTGTFFRDNSIHSVVRNLVHAADRGGFLVFEPWVEGVAVVFAIAVLAVIFAWRFVRRERALRQQPERDARCQLGHAMDALAFVLLAAPITWEHHYVLAIPITAWAAAGWGRAHPVAIALAALLMFAPPTFDLFPLSYHRLAGLVLLLVVTNREPAPQTA
jgi:alpha-1,2-mannosyltransferase